MFKSTWVVKEIVQLCRAVITLNKASISLACEFLSTALRILSRTFARHSCECHANVVRIFMCHELLSRELVAKVLDMFKNLMRIFSPIYFARLSRDVRASVANLSPRNFGEFTIYLKFSLHSYECRTTVARQS